MNVIIAEKLELITVENCKKLSSLALDYAQNHKKLTYCSVGAIAVTVLSSKLRVRKRFFAWLFNVSCDNKGTQLEKHEAIKRAFLEPLAELTSHDPKLREENTIKILEVGVGSGTNFEYYPKGCHLVAVDPNPFFRQYYDNNRSKFPNIKSAEIILSTGEEMNMVPNDSVDAVVVTMVMCSVSDIDKFVRQIKRVLVQGGKFFFIEHVGEWNHKDHPWVYRLQQFLTNIGFWPFVFDGCHLNRNPFPNIRASGGFSDIQHEFFYAPLPGGIPRLVSPHLKGVATK